MSFIISDVIQTEGITTPIGNPPSGSFYLYYKSDGNLYRKDSSGAELSLTGLVIPSGTLVNVLSTADNTVVPINSTTFRSILTTTYNVPTNGNYFLDWYCESLMNTANRNVEFQVLVDGVVIAQPIVTSRTASGENIPISGNSAQISLNSGNRVINIKARVVTVGSSTNISRRRFNLNLKTS